jgi:hypothetical protein
MSGLVLVWDMDNTLVGNYFDVLDRSIQVAVHFNRNALAILKAATVARKYGKVDAIFMLTNNSDKDFIEHVHNKLKIRLGVPEVFDYIMDRTHEARPPPADDPPKRLADVEYMMKAVGKPTYNLSKRVFFFDDIPDHEIGSEIPSTHYIHIFPRFEPFVQDKTNFKPVLDAISARGGKRKKTRKSRKKRGKMSKKNLTNILHDM